MEYRKTYDFTYKDNEGDLYESGVYSSQKEADKAIAELYKEFDGDISIEETWIYKEYKDGTTEFVGRWR